MITGDSNLDALIGAFGDQQEAALYERFPLLARTLEARFTLLRDPDGVTVWLHDNAEVQPAEPFGDFKAAREALMARIMHQLQAAANRADAGS